MAGLVINAETTVGDLVIVNTGATVDLEGSLGEGGHVAPRCDLAGNVTFGADAFLGVGCSVIPGIRIGQKATAGAGSVVVHDIPERVVAVGVTAPAIKRRELTT